MPEVTPTPWLSFDEIKEWIPGNKELVTLDRTNYTRAKQCVDACAALRDDVEPGEWINDVIDYLYRIHFLTPDEIYERCLTLRTALNPRPVGPGAAPAGGGGRMKRPSRNVVSIIDFSRLVGWMFSRCTTQEEQIELEAQLIAMFAG